jgi:hybrid cluster-associated redox disulfide protein
VTPADALQMLVCDVLAEYPATARVLIDHGMACAGCTFSRFETVAEAAAAYGLDAGELARSLAAVPRRDTTGGPEQ